MKNPKRTGFLAMLALSLVAFFSAGCGNSESFVFTGTQNQQPTPGTGNLLFTFNPPPVLTQSDLPLAGDLSPGTDRLEFWLYKKNPPTSTVPDYIREHFVAPGESQFNVTLDEVDTEVKFVAVLARSSVETGSVPLGVWLRTVQVVEDDTTPVDLGESDEVTIEAEPNPMRLVRSAEPDPVQLILNLKCSSADGTFSLDLPLEDYEAEFSFVPEGVVNSTASGQFSADEFTDGYETVATLASLGGLNLDSYPPVTFDIEVYEFAVVDWDHEMVRDTSAEDSFWAEFRGPDGVSSDVYADSPGVVLSLQAPAQDVSITDNVINVGLNAVLESTFVVVVTYTDPDTGLVLTDTFEVTIGPDK